MVTLYGIPNCDSVRKARKWLDTRGIAYAFHDFKKSGIDEATLNAWVAELGWERLLNRRGTTWRKVPQATRSGLDREGAIRLMLQTPSIIKRPLLDLGNGFQIGFDEERYTALFH